MVVFQAARDGRMQRHILGTHKEHTQQQSIASDSALALSRWSLTGTWDQITRIGCLDSRTLPDLPHTFSLGDAGGTLGAWGGAWCIHGTGACIVSGCVCTWHINCA